MSSVTTERAMSPRDVLIAARAVIASPLNWTQHVTARDAAGVEHLAEHPDAVRFCAYGALVRVQGGYERYDHAAFCILSELAGECPIEFNDTHTHAEVLALLDAGIAKASAPQE